MLLSGGLHCLPGHFPSNLVSLCNRALNCGSYINSFLIIIPAIAQLIVDKTSLPVYSAEILDPKPDRVSFSLKTSLSIPAGIKVHIDPVNLTLFIRDEKPVEPYLMVPLHGYDLSGTTNISVTRNDTKILDKPDFIQVLTHAVYQRRFTMSAKGSTVGHLGALDAPLTLNKDVELNGMPETVF